MNPTPRRRSKLSIRALKFTPDSTSPVPSKLDTDSIHSFAKIKTRELPVAYVVVNEDLGILRTFKDLVLDRGKKHKAKGLSILLLGTARFPCWAARTPPPGSWSGASGPSCQTPRNGRIETRTSSAPTGPSSVNSGRRPRDVNPPRPGNCRRPNCRLDCRPTPRCRRTCCWSFSRVCPCRKR